MPLSRYLIFMTLATLLSWASFLVVIFKVNPFNTSGLGFALFYFSLFFTLTGILSLVGFLIRRALVKNQFASEQALTSFRQAVLFGLLVMVSLYLQSKHLMAWWNLSILIVLLAVVEAAFVYYKKT